MLGAILIKARSLMVHTDPASQREDLLRLLSLVADPRELAEGLRVTERKWLRQADERLELRAPSLLGANLHRRAQLAYGLLVRGPTEPTGGAAVLDERGPGSLAVRWTPDERRGLDR